ncbi:MAG: GDP-mannose 4,6-dehydratase [Thermoflexales bacterium]|nr:GDP-mannose 4,6-dehydratase [Thermoflexales bacterium]
MPHSKILVTGGAGFIGGHLCQLLLEEGCQVTAIDDLSTGRLDNIAALHQQPGFSFVRETILNALVLDRLVSECDAVVHLAAAVGVQLILDHPIRTIETNILGSEAVLRAAARYGKKVLLASTSEVYGKSEQVPFSEDDDRVMGATTRGRWSYAETKAMDEFLALAYHREQGLPAVIFRLFNTVGPRQSGQYGMVVPRFVNWALRGEALLVHGDGQQTRCFCHVTDVIRAIAGLLEHSGAVGQIHNIGSTEEVSILELAEHAKAITGSVSPIHFVPYQQLGSDFEDMRRRVPDTRKIQALLGWQPRHTLDDILRDVAADLNVKRET